MTKLPAEFWILSLLPSLMSYHLISTEIPRGHQTETFGNSNGSIWKNRIVLLGKRP